MLIMSQDREMLINFNLVSDIFIRDRTHIVAECPHIENYTLTLGRYETTERAMEVLEEIGSEYCLLTNEEKGYVANGMYYMPKD